MATSRKFISQEDWEEKLNGVELRKEDMNKLVMDFLVTEGHVAAAEKFRHESNTERIDLAATTDRMAVKKAVLFGNMEYAIETLKKLIPEIADTNPQLYFRLQHQQMIELIRRGKVEEALQFAQEQLAPMGVENQDFLEELEKTVSLLVFEDVADLPDVSKRYKMSNEVNTAILSSQSHEKDPKLLPLLKMLEWVQYQLDKNAVYPRMKMIYSTSMSEDLMK